MIRITGLTKRYRQTTVLHEVDLEIQPGTTTALWGPNGAGKTTVLLAIMGLLTHRGNVEVFGHDVARAGKQARALIGFVPQQPGFPPELTVAETLGLSARLRGVGPERASTVAESTGLGSLMTRRTATLSGGERQRLALAAALLHDPPVLLLDEPTANLDAAGRAATIGLLEGFRGPERILVTTSHHLEEVAMLARRVVVMAGGRVVDDVPRSDLADRLGLRSRLHLVIGAKDLDAAQRVLGEHAFRAEHNGSGIVVEVLPTGKAAAVAALIAAGIGVHDIEVWR